MNRIARGMIAALAIAAASPAAADHYPAETKKGVQRKDKALLDGLSRLTYAESTGMVLDALWCDCLEETCEDGFLLGCGGEVVPAHMGFLSAVRRTSRGTCLVCGCSGPEPVELLATPVCAGF
jgi:hypothetical protein